MPKYRKRPIVIEAFAWSGEPGPMPDWLHIACNTGIAQIVSYGDEPLCRLRIDTLEGRMEASPGDWVIQGVKGEIYPCKPDIFAAIYEEEAE